MRNVSTVQTVRSPGREGITTKLPSICTFAHEILRILYIFQSSEVTFEHEHEPNG